MDPLDFVQLTPLMRRTAGRPEIIVALIDGPVLTKESKQWSSHLRHITGTVLSKCDQPDSAACMHGTFVASMLAANRGTQATGICPDCTLLVRTIFPEALNAKTQVPVAAPGALAAAIVDSVRAGARVLNMSVGLAQPSCKGEREIQEALDYAAERGAIPVVAAGNQGTVGGSQMTCHAWSIPVVSCDLSGRPTAESNLGNSIARHGVTAPGENIVGLGPDGDLRSLAGTSVAVPFVTGAIALLWSEFPTASASEVKLAVRQRPLGRRSSLVPPVLNAWAAYQRLSFASGQGKIA
jgi:subtilisin family serine protease